MQGLKCKPLTYRKERRMRIENKQRLHPPGKTSLGVETGNGLNNNRGAGVSGDVLHDGVGNRTLYAGEGLGVGETCDLCAHGKMEERGYLCADNGEKIPMDRALDEGLSCFNFKPKQEETNFQEVALLGCLKINPFNPIAVAQALPEMVEALREFVKYFDCNSVHQFKIYNKAKAALQKAGVE